MAEVGTADQAAQSSAGDGSSSTAENVKEQGQQAVNNAAGKAQDVVRTQVDERSSQAGEQISSAASDLRSVGEQLRSQENESGAKVADQVADRAERAGQYLRESDADKILSDAEDFGRRQPWLVLAGGVALGIAGARFLKASSSRRYQTSSQGSSQAGAPAGGIPRQASPQGGPVQQPWDHPQATGTGLRSDAPATDGAPV